MAGNQIESFGAWVRPISGGQLSEVGRSEGGQVTEHEMKQALRRDALPAILEILEIPFSHAASLPDQPENWQIAGARSWRSLGMCPSNRVAEMADAPATLWDTSGRGWVKVEESLLKGPGFASLYLVAPIGPLQAEVGSRNKSSGSVEKVRYKNLLLPYRGMIHEFRISDLAFDTDYATRFPALGDGKQFFTLPSGTHVTVSLTPAYSPNGNPPRYHYKMAAAIIKPVVT